MFRDAHRASVACRQAISEAPSSISRPLLELLDASEAGGVFSLEGDDLVEAAARLEGVIASVVSIGQDDAVSMSERLPAAFIERNEVFRGVVLRDHRPEIAEAYARVDACLLELEAAVAEFPDSDDVLYDVANCVETNQCVECD